MSSDIVERLRNATRPYMQLGWPLPYKVQRSEPLWHEAADEIERLRRDRDEARREVCNSQQYCVDRSSEEAARRGWDCFKEQHNEQ